MAVCANARTGEISANKIASAMNFMRWSLPSQISLWSVFMDIVAVSPRPARPELANILKVFAVTIAYEYRDAILPTLLKLKTIGLPTLPPQCSAFANSPRGRWCTNCSNQTGM